MAEVSDRQIFTDGRPLPVDPQPSWTVRLNHFIVLDTDLLDYVCLENEKDVPRLVGK